MSGKYRFRKNSWTWVVGAFATAIILLGSPGTADAQQQITGNIGFGGAFTPADDSFAAASLGTATSIDYNGNGVQDSGLGVVVLASGSFASLLYSAATLYDFTFSPLAPGGVNPLWEVGGFSFALDSVTINTQDSQTLSLTGTGIVSASNYIATAGTWNFTGNPAGSSFVFSAGAGPVAAVPEPEIYAMMGAGLGIMGWVTRRKKRRLTAV